MHTKLTSKFLTILKTFSKEELKSFEKWLNSPFAGVNQNLPRLLGAIKKYHPHYEHRKLTREQIFEELFPERKYSTDWLNNLMSQGYLQVEDFLICQNALKNKNLRGDLLVTEFQNRHLEDSFFKFSDKEEARLEKKDIKDWEDYIDLLRLNRRVYHHPNQNPRMKPGSSTIVKMNENLTLVYLIEKAMIINEMIFRNRILKNENHDIKKELTAWRIAAEGVDDLTIDLYRKRFGYTEENIKEQFLELQNIFIERFRELNEKSMKIHFVSLINDSTELGRKKKLSLEEIFTLYKFGIESDLILNNNEITQGRFVTIVNVSNSLGNFEFTNKIIAKYSKKLPKAIQNDGLKWALANTAFKSKKLEKCLEILQGENFKSPVFRNTSNFLRLQAFFEKYLENESYLFILQNYLSSYEKWIIRDKALSKKMKDNYFSLIRASRTLCNLSIGLNFSEDAINRLIENPPIIGRVWFTKTGKEIIKLNKKR